MFAQAILTPLLQGMLTPGQVLAGCRLAESACDWSARGRHGIASSGVNSLLSTCAKPLQGAASLTHRRCIITFAV